MDNKLSELSKPVAWRYRYTKPGITDSHGEAWVGDWKFVTDEVNCNPAPNYQKCALYSQEYVSALKHESAVNWEAAASLNVENQELKKRIAELESANQSQDDHINQQQDRIESLEKTNNGLGQRLGAAEKRLATPVRLPLLYSPDPWMSPDPDGTWLDKEDVKKSIRAAGFTVEGDEQ